MSKVLPGLVILDSGKGMEGIVSRALEVELPCNGGPRWGGGLIAIISDSGTELLMKSAEGSEE